VDQTHGGWLRGTDEPPPIHTRALVKDRVDGQEVAVNKLIVDVCATQRCNLAIVDGLAYLRYGTFNGVREAKLEHPSMVIAGFTWSR